MSEAVAIDLLLSMDGRISFSAKIIVEDIHQALFANVIYETMLEYAQSTLTPDRSEDEDATDDPIKVEACRLLHCITSIKCRGVETTELLSFLQGSGIKTVAATEKTEDSIYNIDLNQPVAIIMGSEDRGINPSVLKIVDEKAKLPMFGSIGSLNVSVACGAFLYETVRQRQ